MFTAAFSTGTSFFKGRLDWVPTHFGDFDSDGKDDLVWYIVAPGQTQFWLMDRMVPTATTTVLTSTDWNVRP